jgi:hypothetical protein
MCSRASAGGTGDLRDRSDVARHGARQGRSASHLGIGVPIALDPERLRRRRVEPAPWDQALRPALAARVRGVPPRRDRLAESALAARFEHHLGEARLTPVRDRVVTDGARHHAIGTGQVGHGRGIGRRPADLKKIGPQRALVLRPAGAATDLPPRPNPATRQLAVGSGCSSTLCDCDIRRCNKRSRSFSSPSARIAAARRAAFTAPARPIASVPTGIPAGI